MWYVRIPYTCDILECHMLESHFKRGDFKKYQNNISERNEFVVNIWKDKLSIYQCNGIICFDLISQNIIVSQDKIQLLAF